MEICIIEITFDARSFRLEFLPNLLGAKKEAIMILPY